MNCTVLQKVCITVPGVRPLPEEELGRRMRAVELIRSGTSESGLTLHSCCVLLTCCTTGIASGLLRQDLKLLPWYTVVKRPLTSSKQLRYSLELVQLLCCCCQQT